MPSNVQPLWPSWPQPQCDPCGPPPHPPGCDCGCQQGWGSNLLQCWDDLSKLKSIIREIMDQVGGPVRTGPIQGVVDGSNAKPGQVGEWVQGTTNGSFGGPISTPQVQMASPLVVPPGDWDLNASLICSFNLDGAGFFATPLPAGLSGQLQGGAILAPPLEIFGQTVTSITQRGSFSVPTLLSFQLTCVNNLSTGGPFIFTATGRRMR